MIKKQKSAEIAVIGAGVIGLSSAILLIESGFRVSIFAKEITDGLTSKAAAAGCFPYKISPVNKALQWTLISLIHFARLMNDPSAGIALLPYREYCTNENVKPRWQKLIYDFAMLTASELPAGYNKGFRAKIYRIDPKYYLKYLLHWFKNLGGNLIQGEVQKLTEIDQQFSIIVNCSGIGAKQLCYDQRVFPIQGHYVLVEKPPQLEQILFADVDEKHYSLIMPRVDDCYLGGTTYKDCLQTKDSSIFQQIIERCETLVPELKGASILETNFALRPGRDEVRLELEILTDGRKVIHNYGHGGAGFSVSWGCAEEMLLLLQKTLR